jgi:transcriptional regulator with XRE-family HTH domain
MFGLGHIRLRMTKIKVLRKPSSPLTATLAMNIRAHREANALSQEEFADSCGLHRTYVGSVERGERNVTLSTLEVFASVMGVSVPQLLTGKTLRNDR